MKRFLYFLITALLVRTAQADTPCIMGEVQLTTASSFTKEFIELQGQYISMHARNDLFAILSSRVEFDSQNYYFRLPKVSNVPFILKGNISQNTQIKVGLCHIGQFPVFFSPYFKHECRPNKLYFFLTNELPLGFKMVDEKSNLRNKFLTDNQTEILVATCEN